MDASILEKWYDGTFAFAVLYAGILVARYALESRERLVRAQVERARLGELLSQAQLAALRRQIEPHFVFNALNAIGGLIREGRTETAIETVVALSDFLRRTLDGSNRHEVPLAGEMEPVRRYLDIQKVRFADRLQLRIDVQAGLETALVPHLILQPLVENAVKPGIAQRLAGGAICIRARKMTACSCST